MGCDRSLTVVGAGFRHLLSGGGGGAVTFIRKCFHRDLRRGVHRIDCRVSQSFHLPVLLFCVYFDGFLEACLCAHVDMFFHDLYINHAYVPTINDSWFRFVLGFCKWAMNWDLG